jgi:hypothetical protein
MIIETEPVIERITGTLVAMAPVSIDDDTRRWARLTAEQIVKQLHLYAETVHIEGEWGFGARDDVRITGYLS